MSNSALGRHNRSATHQPSKRLAVCTPIFPKRLRNLAPVRGVASMSVLLSMKLRYLCTKTSGSGSGESAYLRMTLSQDSCRISSMRFTLAVGPPVSGSFNMTRGAW